MKDLLREVKELEAAIEHANKVADSYNDTAPDCDCAKEHRQLAEWLTELCEIKQARIAAEVLQVKEEPNVDYGILEDDDTCPTCGWAGGLQEEAGALKCPNCGRAFE